MEILINNDQDKVSLDKTISILLQEVAIECLRIEDMGTDYELSITFVDDEEIRVLNKTYRDVDKHTDVLSFPMYDEDEDVPYTPLLGDIVISIETAKRQSEEFGHTVEREIAYLTAHSMFHLLGYDHLEDDDKKEMRGKEKQAMKNLKIFKGDCDQDET